MPRLHIGKRSPSDVVETYCSISVQAPNVIVTIFPALIAAIPAADPTPLAMSHVKDRHVSRFGARCGPNVSRHLFDRSRVNGTRIDSTS